MAINRRTFVRGSAAGGVLFGLGSLAACGGDIDPPQGAGEAVATEPPPEPPPLYPDPLFQEPFVDIDEWRDEPVRHRYVHGGFRGTDLLFSLYFPPPEQYEGRFFHPLMHIAGDENVAPRGRLAGMDGDSIPFAFASGGYLVESNMGSRIMSGPPDITGFRASAATAQYSRVLAVEMYGHHRPYGYVYGGSGGSYKTFACVENTGGIWDGAVPFIHPCPVAMPNVFTVQAHALRVLDGKLDAIVDAVEPGGSGDMYAGLNQEQRGALEEVTRMGMPPRAWFAHERIAFNYTGVFASIIGPLLAEDPGYFEDFWKLPGYLGANPPRSLREARVRHTTTITGIVTTAEARAMGLPVAIAAGTRDSAPAGIRVASLPEGRLQGAFLFPRTGSGVGQRLMLLNVVGDLVMIGFAGENIPALEAMAPGDEIDIDNSEYLAAQTYHRHQMPGPDFKVWDQFRRVDGQPRYPQRPLLKSYNQVGEGNAWQSGRFTCKMITVNCLMDEVAWPWMPDWYRNQVMKVLGPGYSDQYRLWYVDHAMHVNPSRYLSPSEGEPPEEHHSPADTRIVSYAGVLQQALRDVAAWAEKGVVPPAETRYLVDDGQVEVPATAAERGGIQPLVQLTVNGGERADIAVGETVEFVAHIEVPPATGAVVSAEWDFDGSGAYPLRETFADGRAVVTLRTTHTFTEAGTYFPALRAASHRDGDPYTPFARILNLGRVRVVVG